MHSLFHTCEDPFTYWKPGSIEGLQFLAPFVRAGATATVGSGNAGALPPIVTLDAGPNIHVIVAESQYAEWRERLHARFGARAVLEDRPGTGATGVA
jgi:diphosphomevalonate decarboxylase